MATTGERSSPVQGDRASNANAPTARGTVDAPSSRSSSRYSRRQAPAHDQEANVPQYMLLLFADPSQGPAEGSPEAMAE